jgi:hypothetical protein
MTIIRLIPFAALGLLTAACASPGQNAVQTAQERHACANLGIDPGSDAFSGCVANLDATMFEINNAATR